MSDSYTSNIENILNELPETVQWKNNVTRLNQSNMNTLGSAINSLRSAVSNLNTATNIAFGSVDREIKEINDWKTEQTSVHGDIYLNTRFRHIYNSYLESTKSIYRETGIIYSGKTDFQLSSQSKPVIINGPLLQFKGTVNVLNNASFEGSVSMSGKLTVGGNTTLKNTSVSQLNVSGKSTLNEVEITTLKFTTLTDGITPIGFGDILKRTELEVDSYNRNKTDEYSKSNYIPTVKFLQEGLSAYAGGVTEEQLKDAIKNVTITVEQTYDSDSEEALSGKAVSQAITQSKQEMNTTIDTKLNNFIGVGTDISQATADNKFFVVIDVN